MPLVALAALLVALVFVPAAHAGPAEDFQAVAVDYLADGNVTPCRFTRGQLQNTKDNVPPDVARYAPNFLSEVNTEIRRWGAGGCDSPRITSLSLSPAVFRAGTGTAVSFRLSEASTVRFGVERRVRGRRVAGRCVKAKRSNRRRRACTRYPKVSGSFVVRGQAGRNSFRFRGRIGGRKLKRGRYRLSARATDSAENQSALARRNYRVR